MYFDAWVLRNKFDFGKYMHNFIILHKILIEQAEMCLYAVVCVDKNFKNIDRTKQTYRMILCLLYKLAWSLKIFYSQMQWCWNGYMHVHGNAMYQSFDIFSVIISHVSWCLANSNMNFCFYLKGFKFKCWRSSYICALFPLL